MYTVPHTGPELNLGTAMRWSLSMSVRQERVLMTVFRALSIFFSGLSLSLWWVAVSLLCPSSARTACPAACQFSLCIYPDILLMSIEDGGESIGHASRLVWQCGANSPSLGVIHLGKGFVLGGQLMMSLSQPEPLPSRVRASTVTDTYQAAHPAWSCHRVFLPMADWTSSRLWAKQCRLLPGQRQAGLELLPSAVSGS